jgi:hypothetical protein
VETGGVGTGEVETGGDARGAGGGIGANGATGCGRPGLELPRGVL